jgi:integrase
VLAVSAIEDLVFTDSLGAPPVGTTLLRAFQRTLVRARLPVIRWHHLRHLHGALLLASGSDLATVSHLIGHSSVGLTASTDAGILPSLREDAADRLKRLLAR